MTSKTQTFYSSKIKVRKILKILENEIENLRNIKIQEESKSRKGTPFHKAYFEERINSGKLKMVAKNIL